MSTVKKAPATLSVTALTDALISRTPAAANCQCGPDASAGISDRKLIIHRYPRVQDLATIAVERD